MVADGFINREKYKDQLRATGLLMYLGVFETKFGLNTGMILRDPTKDIRLMSFCAQLPYHIFAYRGKTRWLIRNQFEELLPKSILGKWQQRGVLNIDWVQRIYRDWDTIRPMLKHNMSAHIWDEWLDKDLVMSAIEGVGSDSQKDSNTLTHLCAIDALYHFQKWRK